MGQHNAASDQFRSLYDDLYDDVWTYCRRRCRSFEETQDTVADVFTVVWRRLGEAPERADALRPWVFAIARNHLRNGWRNQIRRSRLAQRLACSPVKLVEPPEDEVNGKLRISAVMAALTTLPDSDQELLRAIAWDGLSHQELAAGLGCSENAITIRVHRARRRLLEAVEKQDSRGHRGRTVRGTKDRVT